MKSGAVGVAVLLAVLCTWPLAQHLGTAGRVDSGDGRYGIWNVAWVARALTTDPTTLYDANIFYPHRSALAYSEANLVAGVLAIPVWLMTGNGLAAANSAVLLSFVLSGLAAFFLMRHLTRHTAAAAIGAIMFAYAPYAFARLAHMQLLMTFGLPLTMLALHGFVERPGLKPSLLLGLALWVTAMACGYYGIFAGLAVGWGILWFGVTQRRWRSPTYWGLAILAAATAAVLTAPFLLPYEGIRGEGFGRSLADARLFSADWRAYLASPALVHRWMLPLLGTWKEVLFPGFLPVAFAVVAIAGQRGGPRHTDAHGVVGFYVSLALLAAWASFGPAAGLYAAFFHGLPFFDLIRAPARFGILVTLAVTTLASLGLARVFEALDGRRRTLAIVGLTVATLAGSTVGPLPLTERGPTHAVYQRLAQMPRGPVVEFPYFVDVTDRHRHTEYMLASLAHWQPLINGYSDHQPADALRDGQLLAAFPSDAAWQVLERRGARYVVMHWYAYADDPDIRRRVFASVGTRLRVVIDRGDISLFEVLSPGRP